MSTEIDYSPFPTIARIPAIFGGFTPRQSTFIDNYIGKNGPELIGNGTRSAGAAGYKGDDNVLAVTARQLLRLPKIQQEIKRRLGTSVMSAPEVLEGLTEIARSDIANVFESDGSLDLKKAKKRGQSKLIKTVCFDKDTGKLTKVELYSAHEAKRDLAKVHGLFIERTESLSININLTRDDVLGSLAHSLADVVDVTPEDP